MRFLRKNLLKFAGLGLPPGERKKKKKRTKRIIKKNVTPSTYKYVRNTLNLLNKGGGTARTRVETPLKRHGGQSD